MISSGYVTFGPKCGGESTCVRACPTKAIRLKGRDIVIVGKCIGCGECMRHCPRGNIHPISTTEIETIQEGDFNIAMVSPVLYSQFPDTMPRDVLTGLKQMGFRHTVDVSYFIEMCCDATREFISRNKKSGRTPWPLISSMCPAVVRLIAFRFPSLLPHVIPTIRIADLMAREVKRRITEEYEIKKNEYTLYYINPCPTKASPDFYPSLRKRSSGEEALGINMVYPELLRRVERIKRKDHVSFSKARFEFETCNTGNGPMLGMSGGEIEDLGIDRSLAVSGLHATISYLEKIELGVFRDMEFIELRICPGGCLGGVLNAIDRYLAKSVVRKMIKTLGLGKRLYRNQILRLYDKGFFKNELDPSVLHTIYGDKKTPLSIEQLKQMEELLDLIQGNDCSACGAPDCATFAEDVVRGQAELNACLLLRARENGH
ncbi:MAG: hypothetical protein GY859_15595 [Desulfobacterales bacterium]|nr:hypothetical protein [Desulfobacterales bacterium]